MLQDLLKECLEQFIYFLLINVLPWIQESTVGVC